MSKKESCEYLKHYIKGGHETLIDFGVAMEDAKKSKDFSKARELQKDSQIYKTLVVSRLMIVGDYFESKTFLLTNDTPPGYKGVKFSFGFNLMLPKNQEPSDEVEPLIDAYKRGRLFEFIKELKNIYQRDGELLSILEMLLTAKKHSKLYTKKELVENGIFGNHAKIKLKKRGDVVTKKCVEFDFPRE